MCIYIKVKIKISLNLISRWWTLPRYYKFWQPIAPAANPRDKIWLHSEDNCLIAVSTIWKDLTTQRGDSHSSVLKLQRVTTPKLFWLQLTQHSHSIRVGFWLLDPWHNKGQSQERFLIAQIVQQVSVVNEAQWRHTIKQNANKQHANKQALGAVPQPRSTGPSGPPLRGFCCCCCWSVTTSRVQNHSS